MIFPIFGPGPFCRAPDYEFFVAMTDIQPIGALLQLDAQGYLVNESSPDKIVQPWDGAVAFARRAYLENLSEKVHSLYLVGSIARGRAVAAISDVDTFAVVHGEVDEATRAWMPAVQREFRERFPFATGLELAAYPLREVLEGDTMHYGIKVRGFCLFGEDLAPRIAPFKPDIHLMRYLSFPVRLEIASFVTKIKAAPDADAARGACRSLMKMLLRVGMFLVITREKSHTLDLYPSYVCFSRHYPEHEAGMRMALQLALDPVADIEPLQPFVWGFGGWLADELRRRTDSSEQET